MVSQCDMKIPEKCGILGNTVQLESSAKLYAVVLTLTHDNNYFNTLVRSEDLSTDIDILDWFVRIDQCCF